MSRVMTLTSQQGSHKALISQTTTGSWVRKEKGISLTPNGKEFGMKIFQLQDISGAHSSSKISECRWQKPVHVVGTRQVGCGGVIQDD